MKLQITDISIVVVYLISMLLIGMYFRKKARKTKESYLLAGKKLPWYLLGLSDAADMFDISGTMWMVSLCFVYGFKSIWIPLLWPVFNPVSYTHLRAHETGRNLVCRLLLEKK